jgi:hypothetical protein
MTEDGFVGVGWTAFELQNNMSIAAEEAYKEAYEHLLSHSLNSTAAGHLDTAREAVQEATLKKLGRGIR